MQAPKQEGSDEPDDKVTSETIEECYLPQDSEECSDEND